MTPRLLTIMGSGETAPTMVKVHRRLLERLGPPPVPAVLLNTPFAFQENAAEVAARVVHYFGDSLGAPIEVASTPAGERDAPGPGGPLDRHKSLESGDDPFSEERLVSSLRAARYVFAGPGSPSYALRRWRGTVIPALLAEKLRHGGAVTFSSAAALTLGSHTVPVYEIYKVGADPHWLEGLDLLAVAGLSAAVVPHFNNAEGGTHDTRYCYLGERRLAGLERELPEGGLVLGIDEHTALLLDLDDGSAEVAGLGVVTVRVAGRSRELPAGQSLAISDLLEVAASLAKGVGGHSPAEAGTRSSDEMPGGRGSGPSGSFGTGDPAGSSGKVGGPDGSRSAYTDSPLTTLVREQEAAFAAGISRRDVPAAVAAVLELEDQITQWSLDIPAGDALDRARTSLRSLVVDLGRIGAAAARDPREVLGPFVELMLELRAKARAERRFAEADAVRDRLRALGIEIRDTPEGSEWLLTAERKA